MFAWSNTREHQQLRGANNTSRNNHLFTRYHSVQCTTVTRESNTDGMGSIKYHLQQQTSRHMFTSSEGNVGLTVSLSCDNTSQIQVTLTLLIMMPWEYENINDIILSIKNLPYILAYKSQNLRQNLPEKLGATYHRRIKWIFFQSPKYAISVRPRWRRCRWWIRRRRRRLEWGQLGLYSLAASSTIPQKPPTIYKWISNFGPHRDSIFRGDLYVERLNIRENMKSLWFLSVWQLTTVTLDSPAERGSGWRHANYCDELLEGEKHELSWHDDLDLMSPVGASVLQTCDNTTVITALFTENDTFHSNSVHVLTSTAIDEFQQTLSLSNLTHQEV